MVSVPSIEPWREPSLRTGAYLTTHDLVVEARVRARADRHRTRYCLPCASDFLAEDDVAAVEDYRDAVERDRAA